MADDAIGRYRVATLAWATMNVDLADDLVGGPIAMDLFYEQLMAELSRISGPDAIDLALSTFAIARSLERISDHAAIIGARLLYLITGNPDHLAREVR